MNLDFFIPIAHAAESAAQEGGIVGLFGLNVKLFIAQLVNFGIVLFVLWKWVFTPVTKALQERTKKIEQSLKDAELTTKEKQEFAMWKDREMASARSQAQSIIAESKSAAENVKMEVLAGTKDEQAKLLAKGKQQLEVEKARVLRELKQESAELIVGATEKILREKIDANKDRELIKKALQEVTKY